VLAVETNKALDAVSPIATGAFYVQGDEVFHEKDLLLSKNAMEKYLDDAETEGLV